MQTNWRNLLARFQITPADAYPLFDRLVEIYSHPERHYHNLEHLGEMFRVASRLESDMRNSAAVQLAIWFHDVVYDPRQKDNETRSGVFAYETLIPLGVPTDIANDVVALIETTAHLEERDSPHHPDSTILIDADLAILGAREERYQRYARAIRQEYAWVSDDDYCKGRSRVLRRFLARPRIFQHQILFEEGEEQARANLNAELLQLGG